MTIRKFVLTPTGSTIKFEYSGSTINSHLLYLQDIITYSGCGTYSPYFSSTGATVSLLSCGNLISSSATVGDYVIEWHLNFTGGTLILISGNSGNTDVSIESYHPFSNVPVPGGTLYPVIRYVYLNGIKYISSYSFSENARWSPDLINCLDPVIVSNMTCSNGTLVSSNYSHTIDYNNTTMNIGQATRNLNFILNTDGTTKYFAWIFYGYTVPDTLKITYSGATTQVLDYWTVGLQATTNFTSSPKVWGNNGILQKVSNYSGISYTTNDYLKIEIAPNSATTNTNWTLNMKCLTGATLGSAFNCNNFSYGVNIINSSTPTMTYVNGDTCLYRVVFNFMSGYTDFTNSYLNKYISNNQYGTGYNTYSNTSMTIDLTAPSTGYTIYGTGSYGSCYSLNSALNTSITGNTLAMTFQNNTDYLFYKNSYFTLTGLSSMNNYTSDNTNINHYKRIFLYLLSGTSCGDAQLQKSAFFHMSSPITFDDGNRIITINMSGTTNGTISGITCNNLYDRAGQFTSIQESIGNFTTNISYTYPFSGWYIYGPTYNVIETSREFYYVYTIHPTVIDNVCNLINPWFFNTGGTAGTIWDSSSFVGYYCMPRAFHRIDITNTADPINNYKIYSGINNSTGGPITYYQVYP